MRWAALEILRWGCAGAGLRWRWAALLRWAALACCAGPALALGCAGAGLRWQILRWAALALGCAGAGLRSAPSTAVQFSFLARVTTVQFSQSVS